MGRDSSLRDHGPDIVSVERSIWRRRGAAEMADRRQNISAHHNLVDLLALRNMFWPVDQTRHVHPAVERAELIAAKGRVPSRRRDVLSQSRALLCGCSVIAQQENDSVV